MSLDPPTIWQGQTDRTYPTHKTFLYNQYARLLQDSHGAPIIFLHHGDFKPGRLVALRHQLADAARKAATKPAAVAGKAPPAAAEPALPRLSVMRSAILAVALRDIAPEDAAACRELAEHVKGPFAVLTFPEFHPPQINAVLRALERAVPPQKPKTKEELAKEEAAKNADPATPGRRLKRVREELPPKLSVLGALIEGRVFTKEGLQNVSKMPTLDTLRAQIVGILSAPSAQLAMVLSEASGGKLARTLEGLKQSLEEGQATDSAPLS